MEKYQNKYRSKSTRLQNWDYGWAAAYFITICTKDRKFYFGDVKNGKMDLSPVGAIADVLWHEIRNHAKHVTLGEFIVMPNHVHGILILNRNGGTVTMDDADDGTDGTDGADGAVTNVDTRHALYLRSQTHQPQRPSAQPKPPPHQPPSPPQPPPKTIGQKRFQNQGKNTVSSIIGGYKSAVTKHAGRLGYEFDWQPKFWDHIIRDDGAHSRIANYIKNNPQKWENDKLNGGKGNVVLEPQAEYGEEEWMICC